MRRKFYKTSMTFHWIDLAIIALYLALIIGIGFWNAKKTDSDESFLYASRKLTLPSFVMTLVATWYGLILGVGEMVYFYGLMAWVVNGLLWYGVYILYALYFAPKIQQSQTGTIAGIFENNYGKTVGKVAGVLTAIMTSPAAYILSLVAVIEFFLLSFEIDTTQYHQFLIILVAVFSGLYILWNGFKAVIRTDILQFFLLFIGFIALAVFSIATYGFPDFLLSNENIPDSHFSIPGSMGWQMMIVWGLLAMWTFVDPNFYQRCFSASSAKIAKKGIFYALGFWFIFDALTLFTGLYALGAFPLADAKMGYLVLADNVLPVVFKGIFFTAILAVIMSTIDSFLFVSSSILAKDFFAKWFPKTSIKSLTQWGIVVMILLSILIASMFESVITIIYTIGTVGVSLLLPPLVMALFSRKKIREDFLLLSFGITFLVLLIWILGGWTNLDEWGFPQYFWGIEPMYPGLLVNSYLIVFFRLLGR
jgi:SSS family solute:Na+ symporter